MMQIRENLRQFVIENFLGDRSGDFSDEDSLLDQGLIDSTGVLELVTFVEERFGITIADSDLTPENFDSIQMLTTFIQRQLNTGLEPKSRSVMHV